MEPTDGLSRRRVLRSLAATGVAAGLPTVASGATGPRPAGEDPTVETDDDAVRIEHDGMTAEVRLDPFGVRFSGVDGEGPTGFGYGDASPVAAPPTGDAPVEAAETVAAAAEGAASDRYGTLGFAVSVAEAENTPLEAWAVTVEADIQWVHATRVTDREGATFEVATEVPGLSATVTVDGVDGGLRVRAEPSAPAAVRKSGWSFLRPTGDGANDDRTGERFLGFGERSDGVDQTGSVVENWTEEGPYSTGALKPATDPLVGERFQGGPVGGTNYPVPWFASSDGYGFLLESTYYNEFRLAADRPDAWHVETWEPTFECVVFAGPDPADAVAAFSGFVGRQPEPADWIFGPWFQAAGPGDFREDLTRLFREWDVPTTVRETSIHYLPCADQAGDREFHRERTARDHERGYKVTAYVNSFVCENHPNGAYAEGDSEGYFLQTPGAPDADGDPTQSGETYPVPYFAYFERDHPYHGVVDFTDPEATAWWQDLISKPIEDGYDGWMEDFGEYVPPRSVSADGRTGYELHNRYPTLYHRASHALTTERRGTDFGQFVRAGYTRTAQYARMVWGGDPNQDYSKADGLAAAVSQGQSMGVSGVAYWRSDIGGFVGLLNEEKADEELFLRWAAFGAFNGVMAPRARGYPRPGDDSERAQPWHEDVRPVWRKLCKLRTQLFPYLREAAGTYRESGLPIMRHLAFHYPDDPEVYAADAEYQFLFGRDLLVAPVVTEGARERRLYLPDGEWVNFWDAVEYDEATGAFERVGPVEVVEGGQYVTVDAPLDEIPLFVRAGAELELLPADVDTLANVGSEEYRSLDDVDESEYRTLSFPAGGPPEDVPSDPPSVLPGDPPP
ncbi:TIM-barrel domain-containing protein [Natronomonas marina]|uniref:TIM-barrel domain-containing protein n=1 Tax=Natronomonas marina TaxID=2961939 RepID=UPI0020C9B7A6|nr:TIM-barrel domain-containing protein [Natronomonas marina]